MKRWWGVMVDENQDVTTKYAARSTLCNTINMIAARAVVSLEKNMAHL